MTSADGVTSVEFRGTRSGPASLSILHLVLFRRSIFVKIVSMIKKKKNLEA